MIINVRQRDIRDHRDKMIVLRGKSLSLLCLLAEQLGRVVSKDELIEKNWPSVIASEDSLTHCISEIRAALGPRYRHNLKTFAGRGYMLLGEPSDDDSQMIRLLDKVATEATIPLAKPSIAVMPFELLSESKERQYLADGIADALIVGLAKLRWFQVIGKNSSFDLRDMGVERRQIGKLLKVQYLLEGTLLLCDQRLRLNVTLIEAQSQHQLWAERFDAELKDIFALQDDVTRHIVQTLEPRLQSIEIERVRKLPPKDLGAYDLYLKSLPHIFAYTAEDFAKARNLLQMALTIDRTYVDALTALAECIGRLALNGWSDEPQRDFVESARLADLAIEHDPEHLMALATAAWAHAMFTGNFERALDLAERVLAQDPMVPTIRAYCGWVYVYTGRCQEALDQFAIARQLSPLDRRSYFFQLGMAAAHFFSHNYRNAITILRRILIETPNHIVAQRFLAASLAMSGEEPKAAAVMKELLVQHPSYRLADARRSLMQHQWMMDLWCEALRKAGLQD